MRHAGETTDVHFGSAGIRVIAPLRRFAATNPVQCRRRLQSRIRGPEMRMVQDFASQEPARTGRYVRRNARRQDFPRRKKRLT